MWLSFGLLEIQVRSQLFALIFIKSMNSKDIRTPDKSPSGDSLATKKKAASVDARVEVQDDGNPTEYEPLLVKGDRASIEQNPEPIGETTDKNEDADASPLAQTAVNLLGVDVGRVTEFCVWNPDLLGSFLKLVLAIWFLVQLIGWPRLVNIRHL